MGILWLALAWVLAAQQESTTTTYRTDLNGRRVADATYTSKTSDGFSSRTEWTQSINGRQVPLETTEERVIREDASGRLIERIIRRYDANGNPGPPEKQQVEERKNPDGSVSATTSVYRSDLNGRFQLAERIQEQRTQTGNQVNVQVNIERPNLSGTLEVAERQLRLITTDKTNEQQQVTTYRKDAQGRFQEALRVVISSSEQDGRRVENLAQYEPTDSGQLKLASQVVTRSVKKPDGSESREVDIYRRVPGRADPSAAPQLEERQIIELRKEGDRLVETTLVQRPNVSDPSRLGPPRKIGERVCTGAGCK